MQFANRTFSESKGAMTLKQTRTHDFTTTTTPLLVLTNSRNNIEAYFSTEFSPHFKFAGIQPSPAYVKIWLQKQVGRQIELLRKIIQGTWSAVYSYCTRTPSVRERDRGEGRERESVYVRLKIFKVVQAMHSAGQLAYLTKK